MATTPIIVIAGLISDNGKFLIAKRNLKKSLGGFWEFPGGKLSNNETPEACLKRELMEELHIDSEVGRYLCKNTHEYDNFTIELHLYEVTSFSGALVLTEHEDIQWVGIEELDKYDFAPADLPIINDLLTTWK